MSWSLSIPYGLPENNLSKFSGALQNVACLYDHFSNSRHRESSLPLRPSHRLLHSFAYSAVNGVSDNKQKKLKI